MSAAVIAIVVTTLFTNAPLGSVQRPEQDQQTSGWCSPKVADVTGDVLIVCRGVDPALLEYLNRQLSKTRSTLDERIKRADEWVRRYGELATALSRTGDESGRATLAAERVKAGDLQGAEAILRAMTAGTNPVINSLARAHYDLGRVLDLRFKFDEALTQFARAIELQPARSEYLRRYGYALLDAGRPREAREALERVLGVLETEAGDLTEEALKVNTSFRAEISSNLGIAYRRSHDYAKSEHYDLAAVRLFEIVGDVIGMCETLNNLEISYEEEGRLSEARAVGERALAKLSSVAPERISGSEDERVAELRAGMLVNLSFVYREMNLSVEFSAAVRDAVPQVRRLYARNPVTHSMLLGTALTRDGERLEEVGDQSEAEKRYTEAYSLFRTRTRLTPGEDVGIVDAGTHLANILLPQSRFGEAADIAAIFLPIARRLYADDPVKDTSLIDVLLRTAIISNLSKDSRLPTPCEALREATAAATEDETKKWLRQQQRVAMCEQE